jgi:hypothetical protein
MDYDEAKPITRKYDDDLWIVYPEEKTHLKAGKK